MANITVSSIIDTFMQAASKAAALDAIAAASVAISASAIDWSLGRIFSKTLGANTTFTFSNPVDGQIIIAAITNTASNWTVTWPTVTWSGGSVPTQTTGATSDVYMFVKIGSIIFGSVVLGSAFDPANPGPIGGGTPNTVASTRFDATGSTAMRGTAGPIGGLFLNGSAQAQAGVEMVGATQFGTDSVGNIVYSINRSGIPALRCASNGGVQWSASTTDSSTVEFGLYRFAANTAGLLGGTNAQTFVISRSNDGAGNSSQVNIAASGSTVSFSVVEAGTGAGTLTGYVFDKIISPVSHATAGGPTYVEGAMYYDTTLHKMRIGGAAGWETVTSA